MAEPADQEPGTEPEDDQDAGGDQGEDSGKKAKRRVNMTAMAIIAAMAVAVGGSVFGTFWFIDGERQREIQAWQVRLGIVADGRAASVNDWTEQNFRHIRELSENASLQLYMSELALGSEPPLPGETKSQKDEADTDAEE
ncbi:MAG: hypothetical protein V3U48_08380, partial [Rhodospirillales bacterium]